MTPYKILILSFFLLLPFLSYGQAENGWRWNDNTATFEPPNLVPVPVGTSEGEWNAEVEYQTRILKRSLDFYNRKASAILTKLHNCLRIISDKDVHPAIKEAAIRTARSLFLNQKGEIQESAKWRGLLLDNNYQVGYSFQDLDDYLTSLSNLFTEGKFVNVCWTESEAVDFETYPGAGRLYRVDKEDLSVKYYQRYLSKSFLREKISFLDANGLSFSDEVCKQITFELRLFEIKSDTKPENPNDRFVWTVSINSVGKADDKDCKGLPEIECMPPDPTGIAQTTDNVAANDKSIDETKKANRDSSSITVVEIPVYKPVNGLTYLVPGLGFQHFRKLKKKRGIPTWPIITATSLGSIGTGIYYKTQSDKSYNDYLKSTTFADLNTKYAQAKEENKIFLITAGAGVLTWITSDLIVLIKDRKFARENRTFRENSTTLKIQPSFISTENGMAGGIGLKLRF